MTRATRDIKKIDYELRSLMRKYVCEHATDGGGVDVVVSVIGNERSSNPLRDILGYGFHMGYTGSGPMNLASSLLFDAISDELSDEFQTEIVDKMPNYYQDDETVSVMTQREIWEWVLEKLKSRLATPAVT